MPMLNFQARFAPLVEFGGKRQTIRAYRKDGRDPKAGDRLYLYTGARTKACRKLGEATCRSVRGVELNFHGALCIDGRPVYSNRFNALAQADGFNGTHEIAPMREMIEWFRSTHGLPFHGLLIQWGEVEREG